MTTPIYPEDLEGNAESNLVTGEFHTLTELNDDTYRILIPTFAPFYLRNLLLEHVDTTGAITPLTEGVDYYPCLQYMGATRSIGKPVYGGMYINSRLVEGSLRLRYQTVGGKWCADRDYVYERLAESVYNKRSVWWDNITNVQETFPPTDHNHPVSPLDGMERLLAGLQDLQQAVLQTGTSLSAQLQIHMNDEEMHRPSKATVGLGQVSDLPMATDEEVLERQPIEKYVTLRQILLLLNN